MIEVVLLVLWIITLIAWLVWFISYPIYQKLIKKRRFDWYIYAMGCSIGALALNVFNLLMKITR